MNYNQFFDKDFYNGITLQIPLEILDIIGNVEKPGISIHIIGQGYIFWNKNLLNLYNFSKLENVFLKGDSCITSNKSLIKRYNNIYKEALETEKVNLATEVVEPINRKNFRKIMTGGCLPIYINSDKPNSIFSFMLPANKLISLTPNEVFTLSYKDLDDLLTAKRYEVYANKSKYLFSKRELLCFIGILKGNQAGEIALTLNLKQTTIESYTKNLKNKCGVNSRSQLIAFFIENKILQQIFV